MKNYKENVSSNVLDNKVNTAIRSLDDTISKGVMNGITVADQLKSALQLYNEAMQDYLTLSIEKSTLCAKYSSDNAGSSYNLPGVYSSSTGAFDLQQMKIDNQRIEEILPLLDQAESQKDLYFKMIQNAKNSLAKSLGGIIQASVSLEAFLSQVDELSGFEGKLKTKN